MLFLTEDCTISGLRRHLGFSDVGRGSFSQPYAFEPTSASVNYHGEADSGTTGSDDGFQGVQPSP